MICKIDKDLVVEIGKLLCPLNVQTPCIKETLTSYLIIHAQLDLQGLQTLSGKSKLPISPTKT